MVTLRFQCCQIRIKSRIHDALKVLARLQLKTQAKQKYLVLLYLGTSIAKSLAFSSLWGNSKLGRSTQQCNYLFLTETIYLCYQLQGLATVVAHPMVPVMLKKWVIPGLVSLSTLTEWCSQFGWIWVWCCSYKEISKVKLCYDHDEHSDGPFDIYFPANQSGLKWAWRNFTPKISCSATGLYFRLFNTR